MVNTFSCHATSLFDFARPLDLARISEDFGRSAFRSCCYSADHDSDPDVDPADSATDPATDPAAYPAWRSWCRSPTADLSRSLPADLPADLYHCVKSLRPDRHPFGLIESLRSVSPEDSPANRLCLAVGSGFLLGPSSSLVIKRQKTSENCAKLNEFQSLPFPSRYLPLVRYTFASRSIGSSINSPCSEGQLILLGACIVRAYSSEYVKFRRTSVLPNERSA